MASCLFLSPILIILSAPSAIVEHHFGTACLNLLDYHHPSPSLKEVWNLYILPVLPTPTRQPGRTVPLLFSFFPLILSSSLTYINCFYL
jgi:hypothetical protein